MIFADIFHEINQDLDREGNEWHLNNYYLEFSDDIPTQNTSSEIPSYISLSNSNFKLTFSSELRDLYNPFDSNDLQRLIFLVHQISLIYLYQELWHRCLQACLGQIKPSTLPIRSHSIEQILSFYPNIVTNIMIERGIILTEDHENEINQNLYINFIQNYLQILENKLQYYHLQFNELKKHLKPKYTERLNKKIDQFVQKDGLEMIQIHFQTRIVLIEHMGIDRLYQYDYFQQNPTSDQLEIIKHMCQLTLNKEQAEQELIQLKFGNLFKKYPPILEQLELSPLPSSITTISDLDIRERLSKQYHMILQRTREDLVSLYTQANEFKKMNCEKIFDMKTAEMWQKQRELNSDEQLNKTMITLIAERQKNIITCLKIIYELKGNLFLLIPMPTTTTTTTTTIN